MELLLRDQSRIDPLDGSGAVGDPLTLELLHSLSEADSRATGDTAWTRWK